MKTQNIIRLAKWLLALMVVLYALACLYLYLEQRSFLYHGGNSAPEIAALADAGYQKIDYEAADGQQLWGFYRPPLQREAPILIVFHGNTGIGPIIDDHALPLATLKAGILLTSYRGFDGNSGMPNEIGLAADAIAAMTYLKRQGFAPKQVIIYGHSLGTGVATALAAAEAKANTPTGGLILEAPFTRMVDMARLRYWYMPVDWLLQDRFDTIHKIALVQAPVLVMHGLDDQTIPQNMGQQVCEAALMPKQCKWFAGGGHNDLYAHNALAAVQEFIDASFPAVR